MKSFFKTFINEEDGNATLDWMVLMAGVLMLSVAITATMAGQSMRIAQDTSNAVGSISTDSAI
ncbi:MAG: hypothetical protein P8H53_02580 [Paracoccaceae bacterium]|nr:hypothetical protein [Paracoccaceae bacterium]